MAPSKGSEDRAAERDERRADRDAANQETKPTKQERNDPWVQDPKIRHRI